VQTSLSQNIPAGGILTFAQHFRLKLTQK